MIQRKSLIGIFLWIIYAGSVSQAEARSVTSVSYQTLCSYDPNCKKLVNWDGSMKAPKQDMIFLIKKFRSEIIQAGKDYEVDPRAIAGSLLAENSLNVHVDDKLQDDLVRMGLSPEGKLLGFSFSFGWGQIYTDTAESVEPMMAQIENRPIRNRREIAKALLLPDQSVRYVAALLLKSQTIYQQLGLSIHNNPGILVTLYNLGKESQRALTTKQAGRSPRINYFGYFVELYMDQIQSLLQESKATTMSGMDASPHLSSESIQQSSSRDQLFLKKSVRASYQGKKGRSVNSSPIYIFRAPDQCSTMGSGYEEIRTRNQTYQSFDPVTEVLPQDSVEKLSETMGCGLQAWWLVRTSLGYLGWVPASKISDLKLSRNRDLRAFNPMDEVQAENLRFCQDPKLKSLKYQDYSKAMRLKDAADDPSSSLVFKNLEFDQNSTRLMYQQWYLLIQHSLNKGLMNLNRQRSLNNLKPLSKWEDSSNPFYLLIQKQHDRNMIALLRCTDPLWDCSLPDSKYDFPKDFQVYVHMETMNFNAETLLSWRSKLQVLQPKEMIYRGYELGSVDFHQQTEVALAWIQQCRFENLSSTESSQGRSVMDLFFDDLYQGIQKNGLRGLRWKDPINTPMDSLLFLSQVCEKFIKIRSPSKDSVLSVEAQMIQQKNPSEAIYQWTSSVWNSLGQTTQQRSLYLLPLLKGWMMNSDHLGINIASMYKSYAEEMERGDLAQPCVYDPLILAQQIEELTTSDCIQAIFVSDPWILNYYRSKSTKVIFYPEQRQGTVSTLRQKNCRK